MKTDSILNEKIFELRQQEMSYQKIREALLEQFGETLDLRTIRKRSKEMFQDKGIDQPILKRGRKDSWNQGEKAKQINEEIFELKEQGYSYKNISKKLQEKGIDINEDKIGRLCQKIYKAKGKSVPKAGVLNLIDRDELYKLSEEGLSDDKICEKLNERGIDITYSSLHNIMRKIYKEKGEKRIGGRRQIIGVTDEELYNLRKQGKTIKEISEFYKSKGIDIGEASIYKKVKVIFEQKNEEMLKVREREPKKIYPSEACKEKIYTLRQNRASIKEIKEKLLQEDNIKLSAHYIDRLLKEIYTEKGKIQPKAKTGRKRKNLYIVSSKKKIDSFDEKIYSLREEGVSLESIKEILEREDEFNVSISTISRRMKTIYKEKGEEEPRSSKSKKITQQVCELREQGLNYNEIIEKLYLDYGIEVSKYTIHNICKSVYGPSTKKQIERIGRLKKLEEEYNKLQQTKQESEQLLEQYKMLQNMKEDEQNAKE